MRSKERTTNNEPQTAHRVPYYEFTLIHKNLYSIMTNSNGTEIKSLRVNTHHLSISYEETGPPTGIPVLLLHGFPYSIRQYDSMRDILHTRHPDLRIIVPHLRGFGTTHYLDPTKPRSGSQASIASDLLQLLDALSIPRAILVGYDWGGRAACIVSALHPTRVLGLVSCQGYAIQDIHAAGTTAADPEMTLRRWYTHYFNTPQGVIGLRERRYDFCKLLWKLWSPNWKFTEDEYKAAAETFENEAFVDTVIHSYRHRYGNVPEIEGMGYEEIEERIKGKPRISVPTVVVSGAADGVEPPGPQGEKDGHREFFTGYYERWVLEGVGHCPPAEAPGEVVRAVEVLLGLKQ